MAKDYATLPPNQVRRADRAIEDEAWIAAFLNRAAFGFLATVHSGQPFLNSNLFVYDADAHAIYMHTARVGRTRANITDGMDTAQSSPSGGSPVCFSAAEMGRLLPAEEALEFSVEYSGIVVFGKAQIVTDKAEMRHGLQLLLDKYFPHLQPERDYHPITDDELARTSVYRIDIESWSGKRKQVADDFPGAFQYPIHLPPNAAAGHRTTSPKKD